VAEEIKKKRAGMLTEEYVEVEVEVAWTCECLDPAYDGTDVCSCIERLPTS